MIEIGMIGFGKMAQAIAAGWQNAGLLDRIPCAGVCAAL